MWMAVQIPGTSMSNFFEWKRFLNKGLFKCEEGLLDMVVKKIGNIGRREGLVLVYHLLYSIFTSANLMHENLVAFCVRYLSHDIPRYGTHMGVWLSKEAIQDIVLCHISLNDVLVSLWRHDALQHHSICTRCTRCVTLSFTPQHRGLHKPLLDPFQWDNVAKRNASSFLFLGLFVHAHTIHTLRLSSFWEVVVKSHAFKTWPILVRWNKRIDFRRVINALYTMRIRSSASSTHSKSKVLMVVSSCVSIGWTVRMPPGLSSYSFVVSDWWVYFTCWRVSHVCQVGA